jgi:xanthosine phosphorylase
VTGDRSPYLAVVAGSGMSGLADAFEALSTTPFDAIEGVGPCTVAGHRGEVRWCRRAGRRVAVVLGRRHVYEGEPTAMLRVFERLREAGVTDVVVASAAGSLARDTAPGAVVIVRDALDFQNRDRLAAPARGRRAAPGAPGVALGRPAVRPRVDRGLTDALERACLDVAVRTTRGSLACFPGPTYETPSEVGLSGFTGAALVTMSAAPEVAFANALGMRVAVLATITNFATGIGHATPDHGDVLEIAGNATAGLSRAIAQLVDTYNVESDIPFGG